MATAKLYAPSGEEKGTVDLPAWAFDAPIHRHAMWEVVRAYLANQRQGNASVKNRSAARGGGRKPWSQKKTGRARAGSTRSPVWVGGGRAFGPKPHSFRVEIPKKVRRLALRSALSAKAKDEQVAILAELPLAESKTREVFSVLKNLGVDGARTLLVLPESSESVLRATRNLPKLQTAVYSDLNTYQVLRSDRLVFLSETVDRMREAEVAR
ncbi:MAG: 50S ribosomal protein L4 [Candidatus Eisenbacteria bacterium]|nr:50S ribosomal protein L4 [Candidatus Latescibacterota bacterium]MBD3302758.1 50S ribosomal protein L4 [Candidatus Eisenbacteria bacterium]